MLQLSLYSTRCDVITHGGNREVCGIPKRLEIVAHAHAMCARRSPPSALGNEAKDRPARDRGLYAMQHTIL